MAPSSTEPPLSSLCRICNARLPQYICPRCSLRTCSLACIKRHKVWYECSGVRDATVFVPVKELYTVGGINHDYNFITSIERALERADRIVIDEKGLIPKRSERQEFAASRRFKRKRVDDEVEIFEADNTKKRMVSEAHRLKHACAKSCVMVEKAPPGMQRSKDNTSRVYHGKISWQIEWITDDGKHMLGRIGEKIPLGEGYEEILRKSSGLPSEKRRNPDDLKREDSAKRRKIIDDMARSKPIEAASYLQNPKSARWNVQSSNSIHPGQFLKLPKETSINLPREKVVPFQSQYYFYLLRPSTPACQPKVVAPLDSTDTLSKLLRNRVVLEFPTIYVSKNRPAKMPKCFMMEASYLKGERRDMRKGEEKSVMGLVDYSGSESESGSDSETEGESKSKSDTGSDSDSSDDEDDSDESSSDSEGGEDEQDKDEQSGIISWSESTSEDSDGEDGRK